MAKEISALIKQIRGGAANPSPPVGPAWSKGSKYYGFL